MKVQYEFNYAAFIALLSFLSIPAYCETLFDGSNLDGWTPIGEANWEIKDGALQADTGHGYMVTDASYGNFRLELEFWADVPADSGVFIRCTDPSAPDPSSAYEVNIYDTREDQRYRTGGLVNLVSPLVQMDAANRWNTYEITAEGALITVFMNGTKIAEVEDDQFAAGRIALQHIVGEIRFRNIRLENL